MGIFGYGYLVSGTVNAQAYNAAYYGEEEGGAEIEVDCVPHGNSRSDWGAESCGRI
jgi:hypothetical protein